MKKYVFFGLIIMCVLVLASCARHTPDQNGPNDFSLTSISVQDIISENNCLKTNASRVQRDSSVNINVGMFSGVETIHRFSLNSAAMELTVNLRVHSGNMKLILCNDHEIVKEFFINQGEQNILIPITSDTLYLKAGGESANYELSYNYVVAESQGIVI